MPPAEPAPPGRFKVRIDPESPFFGGHFAGDPIFPGVALLQVVLDAVDEWGGGSSTLSSLRDFRLRSIVRPGDALEVELSGAAGMPEVRFTVKKGDVLVGTGMMTLGSSPNG